MNYISLYRKYRSQNFLEIVGQEHIVRTLSNAIALNRLAHAYLFSGPRGTGKTSIARILAKSLNCVKGPTANPCGVCDLCKKITTGHCLDVIEIDAASNRGIDEIRDLREKVRYAPAEGKYKVYIIDEVHMLTSEAFNALLKTLEEPPQNVVFILATTELTKVPMTIASRCQRLEFRRLSTAQIVGQLDMIIKGEGLKIDDKAKALVARHGEGSLRDAISLLDQLISYCQKEITFDDAVSLLGTADDLMMGNLLSAIFTKDEKKALDILEQAVLEGKSIPQVAQALLYYLRNLLLVKAGSSELLEVSDSERAALEKQASAISLNELKRVILIFSRVETELRWHPHGRLVLELGIVEALQAPVVQSSVVPEKITPATVSGVSSPSIPATKPLTQTNYAARPAATATLTKPEEKKPEVKGVFEDITLTSAFQSAQKNLPPAEPGSLIEKVRNNWEQILDKVKNKTLFGYVSLHEGYPKEVNAQGKLIIQFKKGFSFHKERLEDRANKEAVEAVLFDITGQKILIAGDISSDAHFAQSEESVDPNGISLEMVQKVFGGRVVN
jgi:DNA polymerase-3 subunit gamma/tau